MISFIDDHRAVYGVEPICKVLPIAPSSYHARVTQRTDPATASARARRDADLRTEIRLPGASDRSQDLAARSIHQGTEALERLMEEDAAAERLFVAALAI